MFFRCLKIKNIMSTRLCHHDSKLEKHLVDFYRCWDDNETKKQLENSDKEYNEYIEYKWTNSEDLCNPINSDNKDPK